MVTLIHNNLRKAKVFFREILVSSRAVCLVNGSGGHAGSRGSGRIGAQTSFLILSLQSLGGRRDDER